MEGFQIGNVRIPGKLVLGPMAGVTDLPFRLLCKEQGADLVYTEMISAKGIFYKNKNTELLWMTKEQERPLALQLFGSEPALMADMAAQIEERSFDILDINMGCPVPKVVNNGEGSALMKDPQFAGEIVKAVSSRISKPVTVKFRKGFGADDCNAVEFAKRMEDCGAAAIAVHGRTREAVLWRKGGLGHYPSGEGNGWYSGDRKRRYFHTGGCGGMSGADRMRWSDAGERCAWQSVAVSSDQRISGAWHTRSKTIQRGDGADDPAPRPDADRMQRGADGNAGNA